LEGPKKVELPVALEFLARPFEETTLFAIASAFESLTRHRRPPPGFSDLADRE
jgi:Asp-tRNA(Asn)/Glu-tRNA(Gln) amidotransferase A subunit family amidase